MPLMRIFPLLTVMFLLMLAAGVVLYSYDTSVNLQHSGTMSMSKQTGNQKADEFADRTDQEILAAYQNATGKQKQKLQKELKARQVRNRRKSRGNKQ